MLDKSKKEKEIFWILKIFIFTSNRIQTARDIEHLKGKQKLKMIILINNILKTYIQSRISHVWISVYNPQIENFK